MTNFRKISEAVGFASDKMKKNGLFETERLFCDLYCFEPGQSQAPHTHDGSDKIYYVVEGRGFFSIGEEERELAAGDIAIASSGLRHGVENRASGRLMLLVFMAPKPHK
jgi:quercetin dioxygenase-like cupin family protein